MKRILFLFNILFAVVLVAQAQPKITFDKNVQELGYCLLYTSPSPRDS